MIISHLNTMAEYSIPRIGGPANRALEEANIKNLKDLSKFTEKEIANLHGMGPKGMHILKEAMSTAGITFRK